MHECVVNARKNDRSAGPVASPMVSLCDHRTKAKTMTKQAKPNLSDKPKRGPYDSQKQKRQATPFRLWLKCTQRPVLVGRKGDCFGGFVPT